MKSLFTLAIVSAVILSSCSTYRQGQTPDDVYYSPSREVRGGNNAYVETQSDRDDGRRYDDYNNSRSGYSAYDDFATMDDRWLMMRVRNPYRWSMFDDYSYYNSFSPIGGYYNPHFGGMGFGGGYGGGFGYSPGWSFGLGFGSYSPWGFGNMGMGYGMFNNYNNWNSFYNPYYGGYHPGVIIVNNYGKSNPSGYTTNRSFDLNRYSNSTRLSAAPRYNNANPNRIRYNNSNNSTLDNSGRRTSNGNQYYRTPSRSGDRPVRTYNPSSRNYNPSSGNNSTYSPSSSGSSNSGGGNSPSSGGGGSGSRPSRR